MLTRRALLLALASLLALPVSTWAQPGGKVYRIGFLSAQFAALFQPQLKAFREKLRDLGYAEGRNLVFEYRWAEGRYERLPALARELARLNVDLILTPDGVPPALAAKAATKTIPIVFSAGDAVESGLVASLARPGGNLTGVSVLNVELRKLCKSQRPVIMIEYVRGRIGAHGLGDEAADTGDGGVRTLRQDDAAGGVSGRDGADCAMVGAVRVDRAVLSQAGQWPRAGQGRGEVGPL